MILYLALVALAGIAYGQKSPYASSKPIPGVLPHFTTTTADVGNREGIEETTTPLPTNLQGTLEEDSVVKRVSQWPEEKQPYWYKNKQVITNQRETPVYGSGYEATKYTWGGGSSNQQQQEENGGEWEKYNKQQEKQTEYESNWAKGSKPQEQTKTVIDNNWAKNYKQQQTKVIENSRDWTKNYKGSGGVKEVNVEENNGWKNGKNVKNDGGWGGFQQEKEDETDGGYIQQNENNRGYKQEPEKGKKGSGWFGRFFSRNKKTVTDGGQDGSNQKPASSYGHTSYHHQGYYGQKPQLR